MGDDAPEKTASVGPVLGNVLEPQGCAKSGGERKAEGHGYNG